MKTSVSAIQVLPPLQQLRFNKHQLQLSPLLAGTPVRMVVAHQLNQVSAHQPNQVSEHHHNHSALNQLRLLTQVVQRFQRSRLARQLRLSHRLCQEWTVAIKLPSQCLVLHHRRWHPHNLWLHHLLNPSQLLLQQP